MSSSWVCGPCGWSTSSDDPLPGRDVILDAEWVAHCSTPKHEENRRKWEEGDPVVHRRVRRMIREELIELRAMGIQ